MFNDQIPILEMTAVFHQKPVVCYISAHPYRQYCGPDIVFPYPGDLKQCRSVNDNE